MFDFHTLFVVTMFISGLAGLLLLLAWRQNPTIIALGLWGSAFLMSAVSMMLLIQGGTTPNLAGLSLGTMLWMTAYGIMWTAARSFEGRATPLLATLAGALLFLVACQFESFSNSLSARMMFSSAAVGVYLLLSAGEIWRGSDRELVSRWPAIVVLVVHGGMFLGRMPLIDVLPYPAGALPASSTWFPSGVFELLFFTFCMPLLLVNMAKERAELQQRQHSLIDPLTGVANRRAFNERGAKLLRRTAAEGYGSALLLFDLDRFKNINDTYGHQAGDRVLLEFCETVQPMLRPNDLFGRFGGEEFGCLIAQVSLGEALAVAERIRAAVATMPLVLGRDQRNVTVSVGVAMSNEAGPGLPSLFAAADRALYRAKAKGRNRVEAERKPLQLVPSADAMTG
jgi:diguanylate cyclase (GGDEF)-like protein